MTEKPNNPDFINDRFFKDMSPDEIADYQQRAQTKAVENQRLARMSLPNYSGEDEAQRVVTAYTVMAELSQQDPSPMHRVFYGEVLHNLCTGYPEALPLEKVLEIHDTLEGRTTAQP